jgi:hypothetical protein
MTNADILPPANTSDDPVNIRQQPEAKVANSANLTSLVAESEVRTTPMGMARVTRHNLHRKSCRRRSPIAGRRCKREVCQLLDHHYHADYVDLPASAGQKARIAVRPQVSYR